MFERLSEGFNSALRKLSGQGRITESNVRDAMDDVRAALLEADVHYDIVNDAPVMSTCAGYRRGEADGRDLAVPISAADWASYRDLAPDCTGAWAVYWWQSFPGLGNAAIDQDGQPMKNWWPFLFY